MIVDRVDFNQYCEALLLAHLGYTLYAVVDDREQVVTQTRMVGGDGRNLEVRTVHGWTKATRCWATLSEGEPVATPQGGLFG